MTSANGLTTASDANRFSAMTSTLLAINNPISSSAEVAFDYLAITNGSGEASKAK